MSLIKVLVSGIALLMGAWLAFDGTRALVAGDYTTAKSGPHAGQLGPWSRVISALGLDPRSTPVKALHIVLGVVWMAALLAFIITPSLGWWALAISSICSIWYLPMGTLLSAIELCLLLLPQIRNLR